MSAKSKKNELNEEFIAMWREETEPLAFHVLFVLRQK